MSNEIINLILAQKAEKERLCALPTVKRYALKELKSALSNKLIKVISGPRRAGKSTLALQALGATHFSYINFEDEQIKLASGDAIMEAVDSVYGKNTYCLFDEIQEFPDWATFVNKQQRRGRNLIVTGSNSKLLSSELASSLTGRHETITLLPFSLLEYSSIKLSSSEAPDYKILCADWLKSGGYPEVIIDGLGSKYLTALFDAIILRDVVVRHKIRNVITIKNLAQLLLNSITCRFSARSLERALSSVSFSTIQKYIGYFSEAWLFFELQSFSFKARQRVNSEKKIFCIDNGFMYAASQNVLGGEGSSLENAVFVELLRRGFITNLNLFYAKTTSGYEVDFLLSAYPKDTILIQVAYSLINQSTLERELRAMVSAAKEFKAKELLILTLAEEAQYDIDGYHIKVMPMWKWCLQQQ